MGQISMYEGSGFDLDPGEWSMYWWALPPSDPADPRSIGFCAWTVTAIPQVPDDVSMDEKWSDLEVIVSDVSIVRVRGGFGGYPAHFYGGTIKINWKVTNLSQSKVKGRQIISAVYS